MRPGKEKRRKEQRRGRGRERKGKKRREEGKQESTVMVVGTLIRMKSIFRIKKAERVSLGRMRKKERERERNPSKGPPHRKKPV
jgi:hypothetical protein